MSEFGIGGGDGDFDFARATREVRKHARINFERGPYADSPSGVRAAVTDAAQEELSRRRYGAGDHARVREKATGDLMAELGYD